MRNLLTTKLSITLKCTLSQSPAENDPPPLSALHDIPPSTRKIAHADETSKLPPPTSRFTLTANMGKDLNSQKTRVICVSMHVTPRMKRHQDLSKNLAKLFEHQVKSPHCKNHSSHAQTLDTTYTSEARCSRNTRKPPRWKNCSSHVCLPHHKCQQPS